MSITFQCPHCSDGVTANEKYVGRRARCPNCSSIIVIPEAIEPLPDAALSESDAPLVGDERDVEHDDEYEATPPLIPPKNSAHEDLIDMTPMVDIVFFLLIFFLTTSMTEVQAVMDLPTPQKATDKGGAKSVSDLVTLTVKIQEDDTFWIEDEQILGGQELRKRIRQAREESSVRALSLVIIGNANASHGAAVRVFDAGTAAGVASISLLVKEETEN